MPERPRARRCGRGAELDRWFGAVELRDRRDAQRVRGRAVVVGELARRHAELHGDPVGVVGIDGDAPPVIDAHRVGTVVEPALQAGVEVVEVGRVERDVVRPRGQAQAGGDLGLVLLEHVVVDVPHREQLTVARVVEQMAGPACGGRLRFDLHEVEPHRFRIEAVRLVEVLGGDGNVEIGRAHV